MHGDTDNVSVYRYFGFPCFIYEWEVGETTVIDSTRVYIVNAV